MLKELKKMGTKHTLLQMRVFGAMVIVFLCMVVPGFIKKIQGPVELSSLNTAEYNKQYVRVVMNSSYGMFLQKEGRGSCKNYYRVSAPDDTIMAVCISDPWDQKIADRISDETYEYLHGNIEQIDSNLIVTGTLKKMSDREWEYFSQIMEQAGYTAEDIQQCTTPYVIRQGYVGWLNRITLISLTASAGIFLLCAIVVLFNFLSGSWKKDILSYLKKNPMVTLGQIDADFSTSKKIGNTTWIGKVWTVYFVREEVKIFKNSDMVWAYYRDQPVKVKGISISLPIGQIVVKSMNKKEKILSVAKRDANEILREYKKTQPQMVIGYSKELENCFKKDFGEFLRISRKQQEAAAFNDNRNVIEQWERWNQWQ